MARPGRLCPHCPNFAPCPVHRPAYRGSSAAQGYGARHRQWRDQILARDPVCRDPSGCPNPATHADHVIPIRAGGERYALSNGQGLCATHHNRKTATSDGGFGRPRK